MTAFDTAWGVIKSGLSGWPRDNEDDPPWRATGNVDDDFASDISDEAMNIDYEEIRGNIEMDVGNLLAQIANDYFWEYGVKASGDSFFIGHQSQALYEALMDYVNGHPGLENLGANMGGTE